MVFEFILLNPKQLWTLLNFSQQLILTVDWHLFTLRKSPNPFRKQFFRPVKCSSAKVNRYKSSGSFDLEVQRLLSLIVMA